MWKPHEVAGLGLESCGRGRVAGVTVWLVSSRTERSEAAVRPGVQDSDTERPRELGD